MIHTKQTIVLEVEYKQQPTHDWMIVKNCKGCSENQPNRMKHDRYFSDAQVFQEDKKNYFVENGQSTQKQYFTPSAVGECRKKPRIQKLLYTWPVSNLHEADDTIYQEQPK